MHPRDEKAQLRQAIKDRFSRMSDNQRQAESRSVCRRILEALPEQPIAVAAYFPLKDEVNIQPLLLELLKKGFPLFIPRNEEGKVAFRRVQDLQELVPGAHGILEPPASATAMDDTQPFIALIPGRAFTKDGKRIGRGNGGYDIWIKKQREAKAKGKYWGIALECQIVHDIPMEEHDQKVDKVVTARGLTPA